MQPMSRHAQSAGLRPDVAFAREAACIFRCAEFRCAVFARMPCVKSRLRRSKRNAALFLQQRGALLFWL